MKRIDDKFHLEGERIIKSGNGIPVPDDEPLFLFRARDYLALPTLRFYRQLCVDDGCTDFQIESLDDIIRRFEEFAATSSTMKQPGVTRGK